MINKKPVFFDATGRRAARLATLGWTAALFTLVVAIGFVTSLMVAKPVANVDLPGRAYATNPPELVKKAVAPGLLKQATRLGTEALNRRLEGQRQRRLRNSMPSRVLPAILEPQKGRPLAIGFYVNWGEEGEASFDSSKRALPHLDWVVPSWLTLTGPDLDFHAQPGPALAELHPRAQARCRHPAHDPERRRSDNSTEPRWPVCWPTPSGPRRWPIRS